MTDPVLLILLLAVATFSTRFVGLVVGQYLPDTGPWARGLKALPGSLVISLVTVMLVSGGSIDWIAAGAAIGVAFLTRNLPLTMITGIATVCLLRSFT